MTWNADELNGSKQEIKEYIDKNIFNSDTPTICLFQEIHKETLEKYNNNNNNNNNNYIYIYNDKIRGLFYLQKSWNYNIINDISDDKKDITLNNIQVNEKKIGKYQYSYNGVMWSKHFTLPEIIVPNYIKNQIESNYKATPKKELGIRSSYIIKLLYNNINYNVISVHGLINTEKNIELFESIINNMPNNYNDINIIGGDFNIKKSEISEYNFQNYESDDLFIKTNKNYNEEKKELFYEKLDYIYYKTKKFINVKSETIGKFDDNYKFQTSDHLPVQITIDVKEYDNKIKRYLEWTPTIKQTGDYAIQNPGDRCFQIAAIQLIFHTDEYRKAILKEGYFNKKEDNLLLYYLYEYFKYLIDFYNYNVEKISFSKYLSNNNVNLSDLNVPTNLYECIGRQQDAAELLNNLLDNINLNNRKIKIITESNEIILKEVYEDIDNEFKGKEEYNKTKLENDLYCKTQDSICYTYNKRDIVKFDKTNDYYKKLLKITENFLFTNLLDRFINDTNIINNPLDNFNHFNEYSFFDEDRKINNIPYKNKIINHFKYHTNNIIIIHLKRFLFNDETKKTEKIRNKINIKENITNDNINYKLKGFIEHIGNSMVSGHYVSYIKINNIWYRFNDSNISKKGPKLKDNTDAYILLYEKDKTQSGGYYKKYIKYKQKYINKSIYENYNSDINYYNKYIKYKQKYLLK